jgi:hypothetical protein
LQWWEHADDSMALASVVRAEYAALTP